MERVVSSNVDQLDCVTDYAKQVVTKKIMAGPHVRDACKRHLDDLKNGHKRGLFFDIEKATWVIQFFQEVLCLNGGDYEGVAYDPLPWQKFILGSLFGWMDKDGTRRFRVSYTETSKGSGKSPLAAGIGMYGLVADNEPRAEIYAAATKKDQAMILFRDAVAMVDLSIELSERLTKSGTGSSVWNLTYLEAGSFFRPVSADDGQSGPRPHIALLDEIHEHKNDNVVKMMRAGTKGRKQALIFMISNSGYDKSSVCWHYHDYATKVAAGQIHDDSFFSYVCALDEKDNPFDDEDCWIKTNPSLGVTITKKYLRELVTQAKGMPSSESIVRRLNFSQWVGAESPWISSDVWFEAQEDYNTGLLEGRRCYGGLDLSSTQDLTSLILNFEPTLLDPYWRILSFFWLPDEGLQKKGERDGVDYITWVREGHLQVTPGAAVDKLFVIHVLAELAGKYDIVTVAYDRWRMEDFKQQLINEGICIPLTAFGQGFKDMAPALDVFETALIGGKQKHNGNPCLTWNAANAVVVSDPAGNRKLAKDKSTGRIDGIVASVMASGVVSMMPEPKDLDGFLNFER